MDKNPASSNLFFELSIGILKQETKHSPFLLIVPFSKKQKYLCLGVLFLLIQFSVIKKTGSNKKVFMPHWRFRLQFKFKTYIKFKTYFLQSFFCKTLGVWKLPIWPCSGQIYAHIKGFIHNPESVTRTIYAWQKKSLTNKIFPKWIEGSCSVVLIWSGSNFHTWFLILSKVYSFSIFAFPKNYLIWIKRQSKYLGLCPDIQAVLFVFEIVAC